MTSRRTKQFGAAVTEVQPRVGAPRGRPVACFCLARIRLVFEVEDRKESQNWIDQACEFSLAAHSIEDQLFHGMRCPYED